MSRLIDADEALNLIDGETKVETNSNVKAFNDALEVAIQIIDTQKTVEAIPIEWIYKWLENIPNNWRGYADDWNYNIESEVKKIVYKNNTVILLPCITDMLDDWMEENK